MDAGNSFSVLGLLDGDATIGALRFALRGDHPSALRLPSSPFVAAYAALGHPAARVGASSSGAIGLPAAHVGASSSAAIGLPAAHVGASSSSALGLHAANGGASSSSIPKADAPEIEDLIFDDPTDPSLQLDPVDSDQEDGFTKVRPVRFRMVRGLGPDLTVIPAQEDEETPPTYARARGRLRDVRKWILITETSRGEVDRGWISHHI